MTDIYLTRFPLKRAASIVALAMTITAMPGAAQAATITKPVLKKVESGVDAFGKPSCNFTISFSVTGVNSDTPVSSPTPNADVWHVGVGSASSPLIHGVYLSRQPVGTTQFWNNLSLPGIDRFGAYTPQPYSIRFFETTSANQSPPFQTVIAEIPIPQADLRAAGGVCLDAVVDQRSPRNGTVGN